MNRATNGQCTYAWQERGREIEEGGRKEQEKAAAAEAEEK
jgi:hypothetical protein